MSEKTSRKENTPEELTRAEKLIDDAKVNDARDRGKTEEILMQLLEDENLDYEGRYTTLLNLCELLLIELRITNDLEVLDELNQFITRLLDIAEKSHSYWVLCETLLIQAKLSLLTFDIKKAQRFYPKLNKSLKDLVLIC